MMKDNVRPRAGWLPIVYGAVTGAAVAGMVLMGAFVMRSESRTPNAKVTSGQSGQVSPRSTSGTGTGSINSSRRTSIVVATDEVAPAVVYISAIHERRVQYYEYFRQWEGYFPRLYRRPRSKTQVSYTFGSGVIANTDGYIFTNNHVIANAERIEVSLRDGRVVAGKIVGASPELDVAILKIKADHLVAADLGNSDDLMVGEWAIAIGSPLGQYLADNQPSVTVGVISALHRDIRQSENVGQVFSDMIQTDAAINPGNSGGPLVNARGEVVGINSVIFSGMQHATFNIGLGFAIPINRVKYVFEEILKHGHVRQQWIGFTAIDITPQLQAGLKLPVARGVLIRGVEDGGPADKAGLDPGDVVIAINGVKVANTDEANRLIFTHRIGEKVELTISRDDKLKKIKVEIKPRPQEDI